jgi:hypothetical protein
LLDVSSGKPLWDRPRGKITRVDMGQRQVVINLGSADGVQPELTFSVFGAGPYGNAEKYLKGTIEVTRVLDSRTSQARITSLYDAEGHEVMLNSKGLTRIQHESESALREGDLLFNMFWGNRVAVAGPVSLVPSMGSSPAEQMRRVTDFMYFLEKQGMPIDSYLDLAAAQINGKITQDTRYLILGHELAAGTGLDAERAKGINEMMAEMKKNAIEKGLFIISAENFLNVVGYRPPRSANQAEYHGFRPSLIKAGTAVSSLPGMERRAPAGPAPEANGAPPAPAAVPPAEKENKEKE